MEVVSQVKKFDEYVEPLSSIKLIFYKRTLIRLYLLTLYKYKPIMATNKLNRNNIDYA